MVGEIGININKVYADRNFLRPKDYDISINGHVSNDLSMRSDKGDTFHICGENDWAFLALELLEPIKDEARKIVETVKYRRNNSKCNIRAVVLGKNDKRIMDVYFGGKNKCNRIFGLPVITSDNLNEVSFLTNLEEEIPFFA